MGSCLAKRGSSEVFRVILLNLMCETVSYLKVAFPGTAPAGSLSHVPRGLRDKSSALSARRWWSSHLAVITRCFASASATRLESQVIQRRPHCSAVYAVVPLPQVGSNTKSPGSVVIRMHRSITFGDVCTT